MSPAVDHGIVGSRYQVGGWLGIGATMTNQYPSSVIWPTGGFQFAGGIATQIPLVNKQAVRWFDANDITNFANGTQGTTNTAGTGTVTPAMLTIGANSTSGAQADLEWLNACVRRVKFWPVALPNSQIIALTAP
jgi:L-cystine uptake protein TcyP (sodium:dicarboxylate symporter family)